MKDLGFTLLQVQEIVDDAVSADELRGMLRLRRAELLSRLASESVSITPVIQPLYDELLAALDRAGVTPVGVGIAYYEEMDDGAVLVHAGCPVNVSPHEDYGFAVVDLSAIEQAATIVHHGSMDNVLSTIQELSQWIEANGYRAVGTTGSCTWRWGTIGRSG